MEGISFIVRIRDEEETLEKSIRSLFSLTIPHEILLILHLCKDKSKEIAEKLASENGNIRVLEYNVPISKAGYETLCTRKNSPHSIMTYYSWCYANARCAWKFKWDADFVSTPELIQYINWCGWGAPSVSHELFLDAVSPESTNTERYLVSSKLTFDKYYFWEQISVDSPVKRLWPGVTIIHDSSLSNKKKYWDDDPWFLDFNYLENNPHHMKEALDVAKKYIKVVELCGPEPSGQARASNPICKDIQYKVIQNLETLEKYGIDYAL
jgi:glycosyltransferase involved in cell wall biosynthesis